MRVYAGLFLATFSTLTFEILLTRIFSVTIWYHYAFIAVSVAMLGMTAGALAVYLRPAWFPASRTEIQMAWAASAFGLTMLASMAIHLALPVYDPLRLSITYAATVVPFLFSGVCVCLALTRFVPAVNRMYAADLAGAALGCVGFVALLSVTDGTTALFATAALAIASGYVLVPPEERALKRASTALVVAACAVSALSHYSFQQGRPLLEFRWVKMGPEARPDYERWNAYSRVTVHADAPTSPVLWGMSPAYRADRSVRQLWLRMDAAAGTLLTQFKGDLREVDFLRFDITNLAHHLHPGGKTLVLGSGGGRDVLSALLFGATDVVAVEINDIILDALNGRYGDFTGHLDRIPGVSFVNDEARSWTQRSNAAFDVIQASWIDTWAASAAGALALTENSLYTVEAWRAFLDRLTPNGLLTFTRAFHFQDQKEAARLVSLAREALIVRGVQRPGDHVMLVVNQNLPGAAVRGNATILVSPSPFKAADVARIQALCRELEFRLAVAPGARDASLPLLWAAATGEDLDATARDWPFRLDAPTDDRPFFFNFLSLARMSDAAIAAKGDPQIAALRSLLGLLGTVTALSLVFVVVPLLLAGADLRPGRADVPLVVFFGAIGLGFMFVELALLQRLSLFLGQPAYGIGVALFGLLLSGGAGSYIAGRLRRLAAISGSAVIGALVVLVMAEALLLSVVIQSTQSHSMPVRLTVSLILLAPLGLLMGMAFPLGVRAAADNAQRILPWLWGINGAASVLASVVAVLVSLEFGITANLWIGAACYVLAGVMLFKAAQTRRS